jgi:hypothetical protein
MQMTRLGSMALPFVIENRSYNPLVFFGILGMGALLCIPHLFETAGNQLNDCVDEMDKTSEIELSLLPVNIGNKC